MRSLTSNQKSSSKQRSWSVWDQQGGRVAKTVSVKGREVGDTVREGRGQIVSVVVSH